MSINDIETIITALLDKYPQAQVVEEICNATRTRQQAVKELQGFDALIVVGDPNSNNTTQLANIGRQAKIKISTKLKTVLNWQPLTLIILVRWQSPPGLQPQLSNSAGNQLPQDQR